MNNLNTKNIAFELRRLRVGAKGCQIGTLDANTASRGGTPDCCTQACKGQDSEVYFAMMALSGQKWGKAKFCSTEGKFGQDSNKNSTLEIFGWLGSREQWRMETIRIFVR